MSNKIRDFLWIWGMKVNSLQETDSYKTLMFGTSKITTEQVLQEIGIGNVYIAGGLPIAQETIESIPSACRIVCKTSMHINNNEKNIIDVENALKNLAGAKKLAVDDKRIEAFSLDDFSTGSMDAGIKEDDMARICFENALEFPQLPLHGTIYPMSLGNQGLPEMLAYFDQLLLPIWFPDDVLKSEEYIHSLNDLSGCKPVLFCIYVYDFGNNKMITRRQMQLQLDVVEKLLHKKLVTGCVLLGTCMFDIGLEAVDCMYEWIKRIGDDKVK